jgi:hypothetical protein
LREERSVVAPWAARSVWIRVAGRNLAVEREWVCLAWGLKADGGDGKRERGEPYCSMILASMLRLPEEGRSCWRSSPSKWPSGRGCIHRGLVDPRLYCGGRHL